MPEEIKEKKYTTVNGDWIEIIDSEHKKHILHRIRAIKDFDDVKAGDYGGYIESEENLNQYDNSWIYSDAVRISKNARAWGHSHIYGNAKLYNSAEVCDYGIVCGSSKIYENAKVHGRAKVCGDCYIHGISDISGNAHIEGNIINISDNTIISGRSIIEGSVNINGVVIIDDDATVKGENITIFGHISMTHDVNIRDNAYITSNNDFISIGNVGSRRDLLTSYLTKDLVIMMNTSCFTGTYDEFLSKVKETHGGNQFFEEYQLIASTIKERFTKNRKYN